jgi:NTP pyrophosphatase (non-canonical NTP hydrolase)
LEKDNSHQTGQSFGEIAQLVEQADESEAKPRLEDELAHINMLAKALYMKTADMMKTIAGSEGVATRELF